MNTILPMYILQVIDGGILRYTIPKFDLVKLAEIAGPLITNYLKENGSKEAGDKACKTEDGYAVILHVPGNPSEERTELWTYRFDGQEDVAESLAVIHQQILKMNCEVFVIPSNLLQQRVKEAVSSWQITEDLDGAVLANTILNKLSWCNREWGH